MSAAIGTIADLSIIRRRAAPEVEPNALIAGEALPEPPSTSTICRFCGEGEEEVRGESVVGGLRPVCASVFMDRPRLEEDEGAEWRDEDVSTMGPAVHTEIGMVALDCC